MFLNQHLINIVTTVQRLTDDWRLEHSINHPAWHQEQFVVPPPDVIQWNRGFSLALPPRCLPDWLSCCYLRMSWCFLWNQHSGTSIVSLTIYVAFLRKLQHLLCCLGQPQPHLPPLLPTHHYGLEPGKQASSSPPGKPPLLLLLLHARRQRLHPC